MGRGLSLLQRQILRLALREKFITCQELLSALWDLPSQQQETKKRAIDKAKYASAHATLSRTLTRLWLRNLVEYWRNLSQYRTGVTLTDAGKMLAQAIFAEDEWKQFNG